MIQSKLKYFLLWIMLFASLTILFLLPINPKKNLPTIIPNLISPVPTSIPIFHLQKFKHDGQLDKELAPESKIDYENLTQIEISYQNAKTQQFPGRDLQQTGILIVTSEQDNTSVLTDLPIKGSDAPLDRSLPYNLTPFKIPSIPAGYYMLGAKKNGYVYQTYVILIEPGAVTRLHIHLQPH